jgi:hypothetical protein
VQLHSRSNRAGIAQRARIAGHRGDRVAALQHHPRAEVRESALVPVDRGPGAAPAGAGELGELLAAALHDPPVAAGSDQGR